MSDGVQAAARPDGRQPGPSGADVDTRFLLANERTLLAWVRTAITLEVAGAGVLQFASHVRAQGVIGVTLLFLGAAAGITGYRRFGAADRAIREHKLPPRGKAPELIMLGVVAVSVITAIAYLMVQLRT